MITSKFESINIPSVNIDLINIDGSPTTNFKALFNNQEESIDLNDDLYNWIINNINL
jgi:hypothetical protein